MVLKVGQSGATEKRVKQKVEQATGVAGSVNGILTPNGIIAITGLVVGRSIDAP